jgi:hypothetical protein
MDLHAVDDLEDAFQATKGFLTPVERWTWLKLAFVTLFVGGPAAGANGFPWTFGNTGTTPGAGGPNGVFFDGGELTGTFWLAVAAIVLVGIVIGLVFALVGSVMEFVFVRSLRDQAVSIRAYWREHWRAGVRLFVFRTVVGLVVLASMAVVALPILVGLTGVTEISGGLVLLALVVGVPLVLVVTLVASVVNGFTAVFVVPIMLMEDCGVLAGWRRLWASIREEPMEYLGYVGMRFLLGLGAGVILGAGTIAVLLVLLVPFAVLFGFALAVYAVGGEILGGIVLVVVAAAFVLALIAATALVAMPVKAYLRYYALFVLGDIDPDLDLIPDQRDAVRTDATDADGDGGRAGDGGTGNGDDPSAGGGSD